jgi:hypothetical protein
MPMPKMISPEAKAAFRRFVTTAKLFPGDTKGAFDDKGVYDRARRRGAHDDEESSVEECLKQIAQWAEQHVSPQQHASLDEHLANLLAAHGRDTAQDDDEDEDEDETEPVPIKHGGTREQHEKFGHSGHDQFGERGRPGDPVPVSEQHPRMPMDDRKLRKAMDALPPRLRAEVAVRLTANRSRAESSYASRFPDSVKIGKAY